MKRFAPVRLLLVLFVCLVAGSAGAVHEKADGFPWNLTLKGDYDQPIADKLGSGFFMNVGPTGIRARITRELPQFFTVKFVFENSPAAGKINPGDVIVGANGRVMNVAHEFGRRRVTGWKGPMEEMAKLIEDSQGEDGVLNLIVWPNGVQSEQKVVPVQIPAVGRFSDTFPFNCPRSDALMIELTDFLAHEYQRKGSFGRVHTASASVLALMATGDNKHSDIIRDYVGKIAKKRYDSANGGGFPTWSFGLDGIVMGEYYLLTKDQSVVPAINSLVKCMAESQDPRTGGYMHKPFPYIQTRIANGGPKGYGSMAGTAGQIFLAQSIIRAGGLEVDPWCYSRLHQSYLQSADDSGTIGYGFSSWNYAVVKPTGDSAKLLENAPGIGFRLPGNMEGIDTFDVVWPTPDDKRFKPLDWIQRERDRVIVLNNGNGQLMLVRDMTLPELAGPVRHNGKRVHHTFRTGTAALGHFIGHQDNEPWLHMGRHLADSCANSPQSLLDGHASTLMHTLWGSLGASRSERGFRSYMDGIKWWFIMAQTHDAGFVCMPGRDYASTDHVYAGRNFPSATAALILSVKDAKIQITGASSPLAERRDAQQQAQSDTSKPSPLDGIALSMLGDDLKITHNINEAKLFASSAPYLRVLEALDAKGEGEDAAAEEARRFAQRIRDWLSERAVQIVIDADRVPAQTLARSRAHLRRMDGIFDANAILAEVKLSRAGDDENTRTLARYFEQHDKIVEQEAKRGPTGSTRQNREQLAMLLDRYLQKPDLTAALTAEADQLRKQLQ